MSAAVSNGEDRYFLGDSLVDRYLEFVAGRVRSNTLRAVAFDLKTFFTVVDKSPTEVVAADIFDFLAHRRGDRRVVRLIDGESGLAARTIARRLSSVSGFYSHVIARDDTPLRSNPLPRGLSTRRRGGRRSLAPLVRVPRTLPQILSLQDDHRLRSGVRESGSGSNRLQRPEATQSFALDVVRRTSHPQVVHNVALVLGGGGAAGNAWEIGVIAGLAEAGLDMTESADLVVGTSAGATAAAQVCSGIPIAELLVSVLSPPVRPVGQNQEQPSSLPLATVFERMRAIGAAATSAADSQRAMGAFGLECDSRLGPWAGQRRPMVASRLPRHEWPDRPMIVVTVNALTGGLATFDRDSGVDLVDEVAASTALPV